MRVGAIDVGSNSVRLLVADVELAGGERGKVIAVARAGEACRLARGLERTREIDPEIAERAGQIVEEFARRARSLGAAHILMGATAALRGATNSGDVTRLLESSSGLELRILSGEEEARLTYRAVVAGLGASAQRSPCVVFDIGGGSTEVVSGVGEQAGRWISLPFGAVSLTERFISTDPPDPGQVDALRAHVRSVVMRECAYLPARAPLFAGVGGTITLLAGLDLEIQAYDPGLLEGHYLPITRLHRLIDRLCASAQSDRRAWPIMGEGRADIVVAGALAVGVLAERFPSEQLICSTQGLRYGLARLAAEEQAGGDAA